MSADVWRRCASVVFRMRTRPTCASAVAASMPTRCSTVMKRIGAFRITSPRFLQATVATGLRTNESVRPTSTCTSRLITNQRPTASSVGCQAARFMRPLSARADAASARINTTHRSHECANRKAVYIRFLLLYLTEQAFYVSVDRTAGAEIGTLSSMESFDRRHLERRLTRSSQQCHRTSRDQRAGPDQIEVEPGPTQDSDTELLEHQHGDECRHGQIAHAVQTGGDERRSRVRSGGSGHVM